MVQTDRRFRLDDKTRLKIEDIRIALLSIQECYMKSQNSVPLTYLNSLKSALNKFFTDAECKEVIYTSNTDKCFFGMCVMPQIDGTQVEHIITSEDPFRVTHYYLEIDSKLLSPVLNLTTKELTAVTLHEIGHMVNTAAPADEVRQELDVYLMKNDETLSLKDSANYRELIAYGFKDAMHKITSMFVGSNYEEVLADQFVIDCGYGDALVSALNKITHNTRSLNRDVSNKFIVFSWMMRIYKNVTERRITAMHALRKARSYTPSKLERREIDATLIRLNSMGEELHENSMADKIASARHKYKYDILRQYEDDYYELAIRLKSSNTEDDALRLLRDINRRLSVVEEFLNTEVLDEPERKRFFKLQENLINLRETLSSRNISKSRMLSLWVEYPEIHDNR
jgi:hypothetical protein